MKTEDKDKPVKSAALLAVRELRKQMNLRLCLRQEGVTSLLTAAVSGQHIVIIGPPGTGKSLTVRLFAQGLGFDTAERGDYFELLMTKSTRDVEVLGAWMLERVKADIWDRKVSGKLPAAKVAFLDETFKASSVVLNGLLGLMNERILHQDSGAIQCPLQMLIGASNELPEDDEGLNALWDRFALRTVFSTVSLNLEGMTALAEFREKRHPAMPSCVTIEQLNAAKAEASLVELTPEGRDCLWEIISAARGTGALISDRRLAAIEMHVKAAAWLAGDQRVLTKHLAGLVDMLWDTEDQRKAICEFMKVMKIKMPKFDMALGKITELVENAEKAAKDGWIQMEVSILMRATKEAKLAASMAQQEAKGRSGKESEAMLRTEANFITIANDLGKKCAQRYAESMGSYAGQVDEHTGQVDEHTGQVDK